mgnify:FL=1
MVVERDERDERDGGTRTRGTNTGSRTSPSQTDGSPDSGAAEILSYYTDTAKLSWSRRAWSSAVAFFNPCFDDVSLGVLPVALSRRGPWNSMSSQLPC